MKNKFLQIFLFTLFISLIINPNLISNEVKFALNTFVNTLFPSIFPFFLISDLLINYNFQETLNKIFSNITNFLFHTSNASNFVIIMSLFSGFPSGSKYIRNLYDKKQITLDQANYLITFTHFSNPLFILLITKNIFHDNKFSIIILISHILSNILIGIIIRPKEKEITKRIIANNQLSFSSALANSISTSVNLLFIILGNTIFFFYISKLITYYLNIRGISLVLVNGLFDITKGINSIKFINTTYNFKAILILTFLAFGGINIHMQVLNIIKNTKISYKNFLFGRISQTAISIIIFLFISNIYLKSNLAMVILYQ